MRLGFQAAHCSELEEQHLVSQARTICIAKHNYSPRVICSCNAMHGPLEVCKFFCPSPLDSRFEKMEGDAECNHRTRSRCQCLNTVVLMYNCIKRRFKGKEKMRRRVHRHVRWSYQEEGDEGSLRQAILQMPHVRTATC